jgi:hypothetical protein
MIIVIIKIKYICENAGYLVTFSKSSNIAPFDEGSPFQRERKGNKVTAILHTYFILFVMAIWQKPSCNIDRIKQRNGRRR